MPYPSFGSLTSSVGGTQDRRGTGGSPSTPCIVATTSTSIASTASIAETRTRARGADAHNGQLLNASVIRVLLAPAATTAAL